MVVLLGVFACNHPQNTIQLSTHQVNSILDSNGIQHKDIEYFVTLDEKKTIVQKWLGSQEKPLQDMLLVQANNRINTYKQRNVYTTYLLWKNRGRDQSWEELLTPKEKNLLIHDSPKYWLSMYDSLLARSQAIDYNLNRKYLQYNELRQWIV